MRRLEAATCGASNPLQCLPDEPSATLTLDRWCARHQLGDGGRIVADRVMGEDKTAPGDVRAQLRADAGVPIAYRRVRLRCGERVPSEADNWYVPSRLTSEMNDALETSD